MPQVKGARAYTIEQVAGSLQRAKGLITLAAADLKADYKTVKRMVNESATLQKVQADCKQQMGDFTEGKLFEAIGRGEPWAVQFYLRTQAKDRGYSDAGDLATFLRAKAVELAAERGVEESLALREADRILEAARRG